MDHQGNKEQIDESAQYDSMVAHSTDLFDVLDGQLASDIENEGYTDGYERGKNDGLLEGQLIGEQEGARRGSELGYLHGYAMTFKQLLFPDENVTESDSNRYGQKIQSREEKILSDLLKLINNYPHTNETNCEEKLQTIQVKFKQLFGASVSDVIQSGLYNQVSQDGIDSPSTENT